MSQFTKTLIVDVDGGGDYRTIREAAADAGMINYGGTIIVEQGEYIIDGTTNNGDKRTVENSLQCHNHRHRQCCYQDNDTKQYISFQKYYSRCRQHKH